jgi:hypothetical protein
MPFCRKCGRRLPEYSESCPDCKTSTTAPIINTKRTQGSRLTRDNGSAKIAKAITQQLPIQVKVIANKSVKATASPKTATSHQAGTPKASVQAKTTAPAYVNYFKSQEKVVEIPKPTISAKHIVKPKRVAPSKPIAPFTISFARPVATPKPVTRSIPPAPVRPIVHPKPVAPATPVAPLKVASQPKPIVTPAKLAPLPKPITPAPVYPPHEIIKSNISLKEDITAHPHDYERQPFAFDLQCPNGHFWPAGKPLVVSNGKAFCLQCGEQLRKPKPKRKMRNRYRKYN